MESKKTLTLIDEILEIGKDKLKSREGKEALSFLKKYKKELYVGKDLLSKFVAFVGVEEPEKAKDLFLIQYQSAQVLIDGMNDSGEIFQKAHKEMLKKTEEISEMWKNLGYDAARALLPIIVSIL